MQYSNKQRPLGVKILGAIIIITSLAQMFTLLDFAYYEYLFNDLPKAALLARYCLSWLLRVTGLITGIGILLLNNTCRRTGLYLFLFTLCTVAWKHPYAGFEKHAAHLDQLLRTYGIHKLILIGVKLPPFSSVAIISAMGARIADTTFAVICIYYFTRSEVRQYFVAQEKKHSTGLMERLLARKRSHIADALIPQALRAGSILDVGCGLPPLFLRTVRFAHKSGVDIKVNHAAATGGIIVKKINLDRDNALPFADNFFEVVTMLAVLEHLQPDKIPHLFKEIKRVLKPGGRCIVTTPCPWAAKLITLMSKFELVDPEKVRGHRGKYNKQGIFSYYEQAGFDRERMRFGYFELFMNSWSYVDKT
jgi:SAM-dependent methyltransferase